MPSLRSFKPRKVHTCTGFFDSDRDSGIDVSGPTSQALPVRRSEADYYNSYSGYLNSFPKISSSTILSSSQPPPSYYDIQSPPSLRPARIPVLPREEEGREQLPQYYCSLHREAVFYTKMELSSPFERAADRSWNKEYVVLHGTLLRIHKPRRIPFFATPEMRSGLGEDGSVRPEGWMPGELTRSYTLQGAEVGIATDYKKRHFVIRVRAETEQFLLSSKNVDEFMAWLEALSAAVDLSPALEERTLPRYQTIPRRRRRRGRQVIEEQERIIRSQFPHLIEATTEEEDEGGSRRNSTSTADRDEMIRPSRFRRVRERRNSQESITEQDLRELRSDFESSAAPAQPRPEIVTSPSSSSSTSNSNATGAASSTFSSSSSPRRRQASSTPSSIHRMNPEPSTEDADGKWRPSNPLTHEANLRYARRCMAVLCEDTPRQSDFIVKDGMRYRVLWEKKLLVAETSLQDSSRYWDSVALPQYENIMEERPVVMVQPGIAPTSRPTVIRRISPGPGIGPSRSVSMLRTVAAGGRLSRGV